MPCPCVGGPGAWRRGAAAASIRSHSPQHSLMPHAAGPSPMHTHCCVEGLDLLTPSVRMPCRLNLPNPPQQLSTSEPWSASIPRCPGTEVPYSAHVVIKHSSSSYRPPPSTVNPISTGSSRPSPLLAPPDVIAAAMDSKLHFWVWPATSSTSTAAALDSASASSTSAAAAQPAAAAGVGVGGLSQALQNPALFAHGASAGAQHYCSHPQYSHTATIDTLIEVPTRSGAVG